MRSWRPIKLACDIRGYNCSCAAQQKWLLYRFLRTFTQNLGFGGRFLEASLYRYTKLAWDRSLAMRPPGMGFSMSLGARMFSRKHLVKDLCCYHHCHGDTDAKPSCYNTTTLLSLLSSDFYSAAHQKNDWHSFHLGKHHVNLPLPP